ncbi:restriction endonuclease [Flavobacterium sp. 17A]|uniref:Restriction endonuclease n=1 Tax=Flavobacterium potami TaxID=2872310 RepID=A0A9X1H842_9FLAO|nr:MULTISPECIES: restriction endonuclease [Flavobacterium]MBZ4033887.1 restriction endonuclease [Flavobacterium potami]
MKDHNKLDWQTYELITKYIYETLGQQYNINIEGYGRNCKIIGHSGVQHQIDVLTSETDQSGRYRTAIECKYLNKKVNKDIVMKLLAIINDTDVKRGIIVSKSGYTPDAYQFAKHNKILIVQLREAKKETKGPPKQMHFFDIVLNIKINIKRPEVTEIIALDIDDKIINLDEKNQYHIYVNKPNGRKTTLFDEIMIFKEYLNKQRPFKTVTKTYEFQDSILRLQNSTQKIKRITFTGLLNVQDKNQNTTFSIVDKVWLIMEKLFEEQIFIISQSGIIVQNLDNKQ